MLHFIYSAFSCPLHIETDDRYMVASVLHCPALSCIVLHCPYFLFLSHIVLHCLYFLPFFFILSCIVLTFCLFSLFCPALSCIWISFLKKKLEVIFNLNIKCYLSVIGYYTCQVLCAEGGAGRRGLGLSISDGAWYPLALYVLGHVRHIFPFWIDISFLANILNIPNCNNKYLHSLQFIE